MEKIQISQELLNNTNNIYLKEFINKYIESIKEIESNKCWKKEFIQFDNCITYIKKVDFDITGWMLFEIPICTYLHCFWNKTEKKAFDLVVWDTGKVIPRYTDKCNKEQYANSIQEAIEKYDIKNYINVDK